MEKENKRYLGDPSPDFEMMELVIDIAAEHFGLRSKRDRDALKMFFDAYLNEYVNGCISLHGGD